MTRRFLSIQNTRPKWLISQTRMQVVQGQEMLVSYRNYFPSICLHLSGWKEWYNERYPDAVNNAVDRVWDQVNNLRDCMDYIDKHILSRIFNDTCSPLPILSIVDLDMFVAFISWFFVISLSISNFTKVCNQMPYLSPLTEILSQQSEVPYRLFFVATARLVVERPVDGRLSLSCVKVCTWVRTVPPVTGRW